MGAGVSALKGWAWPAMLLSDSMMSNGILDRHHFGNLTETVRLDENIHQKLPDVALRDRVAVDVADASAVDADCVYAVVSRAPLHVIGRRDDVGCVIAMR